MDTLLTLWLRFWAAFILVMLAASFLIALTSCANRLSAMRDRPPWEVATVYYHEEVTYRGKSVSGLTSYKASPRSAKIDVATNSGHARAYCVTIHELLHALGLRDHGGDTYFDGDGTSDMGLSLDQETVKRLLATMDCDLQVLHYGAFGDILGSAVDFLNAVLAKHDHPYRLVHA